MDIPVINLEHKLSKITEHWSPGIVAQMNDYHLKLAKLYGDFVWHSHPETDEVFIVLAGQLLLDLPGRTEELGPGEMVVVPKGVQHRPRAEAECHVMLIEPAGTLNTGDAGGDRTVEKPVWI